MSADGAVTAGEQATAPTLADRLRRVRAATFVGREPEIAVFRAALDGTADPAVLYVWGPGGSGKSALLRRLGDEAEAAGRRLVRLDGRMIERSPAGVERAAREAREPGRVLLVDTFEACQGMEGWFWDTFLPGLPADCLVVLASRLAPDPRRSADAEWSAIGRVLPLGALSRTEAVALLRGRGVPEPLGNEWYGFTGGHPLALILAAEVAARGDGRPGGWTSHEPAIKTLLDRLVGDLPSPAHRRALTAAIWADAGRAGLPRPGTRIGIHRFTTVAGGPDEAAHRPRHAPLSRVEFDRAVRDLLRTWHHQPSVAGNPLVHSRLAGTGDDHADRVDALRAAVEEAVDSLRGIRRGDQLHRTLATTFFHGRITQTAAAARLAVPFGTYRHQLSAALDRVAETLWQRATGPGR